MDIEQLTKSQIILLTLFVSFITSIATGIVTVALMEQAPPAIEQTVNRVIERTVERIVPTVQTATVATVREKTVVVKDADLIAQSVQKITPSIVRIYATGEGGAFMGFGLVVDASGTVVSDVDAFGESADGIAKLNDGTKLRVFVTHREKTTGIVTLQPATSTEASPAWAPATIMANVAPIGQSVAAVAGRSAPRVGAGIVTTVSVSEAADGQRIIDTDIPSDMLLPGAILMTSDGEAAGMSTAVSRAISANAFVPLNVLLRSTSDTKEKTKTQ